MALPITLAAEWPNARIAALLRQARLWPDLTEAAIDAIRMAGRLVRIAEGRQVTFRAEPTDRMYIVLAGAIRLCMRTTDDREFLVALSQPGEVCFLVACLDGRPSQYDAYAQLPTVALSIEASALRALLQHSAEIQNAVLLLLCRRLRQSFNGLEQFAMWPPRARLAACLIRLARSGDHSAGDEIAITSHVQQESLAAMIGVSRPRTNKILRELEQAGVVRLGYGRITIPDLGRLRQELEIP